MSHPRRPGRALPALLGIALAPAAATPPSAEPPLGPEVVVTATRTARTADESLASVQVIGREAIEASGAHTLPELLQGLPGIQLTTNGGPFGKATSLRLDGAGPQQTLVLVDGVRIGTLSAVGPGLDLLPLDQVERIEVVHGPRSALYGADAVGGVVQIFTRHRAAPGRSLALGAGSYATYRAAASVSGGGRAPYTLSLAQLGTRGLNATTPDNAFAFEPDRDPFRSTSLGAAVDLPLGPARLALRGQGAEGRTRYDGFVDRTDFTRATWSARLELPGAGSWQPRLLAGGNRDRRVNLKEATGARRSVTDARRYTLSWQNDLAVGAGGLLTLGVDRYLDRLNGTTAYARDGRFATGLFVQHQAELRRGRLLLGARRAKDQQFGWSTTGNVAWGLKLGPSAAFHLGWGKAFRAPNFDDLYYPPQRSSFGGTVFLYQANAELRPERSRTWEMGLRGRLAAGGWELRAFRTRVDDLISVGPCPVVPAGVDLCSTTLNVARARIQGLQLGLHGRRGPWSGRLALSWTDPRDLDTRLLLPRRAQGSFRLEVDRRAGPWRVGLAARGMSHRYDDRSNTHRLGGYTVLDLHLALRTASHWEASLRWANLLDRRYRLVQGYAEPGAHVFAELRYREG